MLKKFFTKRRIIYLSCSVASLVAMWVFWIIAYYAVGNRLIVPSFTETLKCFWQYLGTLPFWTAVGNSFGRTLLAFAISFLIALACAALAVLGGAFKAALKPVMVIVRTLPTMAVVLIILKITSGNRSLSPVIVTTLVLLPMIYAQFVAAIEDIDGGIKEMAIVYGIKKRDRLFRIYLPLTAPNILSQTGANISLGLKVLISAEVLVSTANGLGGMMAANTAAEAAKLAALTVAAVILGLLIEVSFSQFTRLTKKWTVANV